MGGVQNREYWPCYEEVVIDYLQPGANNVQPENAQINQAQNISMGRVDQVRVGLQILQSTQDRYNRPCLLCEFEVNFIKTDYRRNQKTWYKVHPYVNEFKEDLTIRQYVDHYVTDTYLIQADKCLSKMEETYQQIFPEKLVVPFPRIENLIIISQPPIAILHDDLIGNMANSHYQVYISQPQQKFSKKGTKIGQQLDALMNQEFSNKSSTLECVIYILKNCHYQYFKPNQSFEYIFFDEKESKRFNGLNFIISLYKQMAHMAYNFRYIFLRYIDETDKNNYNKIIAVYNYLFTCYMEVSFSINNQYTQLGDHIQDMYSNIVFNDADRPHFRLITSFVKFWALLFLSNQVCWTILTEAWRAAQRQQSPDLPNQLHQLIASIIDVSYNQISIHWLGDDRVENEPNQFLFNFIKIYIQEAERYYNQLLEMTMEECFNALDEDLRTQRKIFPDWLIDCHVEPFILKYKYRKIRHLIYQQLDNLITSDDTIFLGKSKIKQKPKEQLFEDILLSQDFSHEVEVEQTLEQQQNRVQTQFIEQENIIKRVETAEAFSKTQVVFEQSNAEVLKWLQMVETQTQDDITAIFLKNSQILNKSYSELRKTNSDTYFTARTASSTTGQQGSFIVQSGLIPHYTKASLEGVELAKQIDKYLKEKLLKIRKEEDMNIARRLSRLESQTLRAKFYGIIEGRKSQLMDYLRQDDLYEDVRYTITSSTLKGSLKDFFFINIKNLAQRIQQIKEEIQKSDEDNNAIQQTLKIQFKDIQEEYVKLNKYLQVLGEVG